MTILDLTHTLNASTMAYPGTEPPRLTRVNTIERDGFEETLLQIFSHTGTHMDAPAHMLAGAPSLDELPAAAFCGSAYVLDCTDLAPGEAIGVARLRAQKAIAAADFLLLSSGWERFWGAAEYFGAFPLLAPEAVEYLLTLRLKGIGADMMSVDAMDSTDFPNHHRFFARGMVLIENLCNLAALRGKSVSFAALPLKYEKADGAPIRAIAAWESPSV